MKLLPSRGLQEKKRTVALDESIRVSEVRKELSREERHLELFKEQTRIERKQIQDDFEGKIMAWNETLRELEQETKILSANRDELLASIDGMKEQASHNLSLSDEALKSLNKRKNEITAEKKSLDSLIKQEKIKLDELLNREHHLNGREIEIAERDEKLKELEELTTINAQKVNSGLNKKNIELMLLEDRINKKEVELAEREKLIAQDKEKIIKDRARIESQQQTLIAAYAEARKNNII